MDVFVVVVKQHCKCAVFLTWHRAEGALGVDSRLDSDDSLSLRTPAFLTLSFHLEQVGLVGQKLLNHHGVLRWVSDVHALHFTYRDKITIHI